MFCTQCGNEVEQHARFCSKCGRELSPILGEPKAHHDMNLHITILSWLFIGHAILMGFVGMVVIFASQLVRRLPIPWPPDFPEAMVPFIGSVIVIVGFAILALAAGVAAAGIGLLQYRSWGRVLAIVMAVLLLFHFPIGTAFAIYAFWVLFSPEGQNHYGNHSAPAKA